ncbi:4Fe-4S binding protein, partial [candidate division KSB3 bacterium]|nr:4Fe-4S binding protein [candidate division KSB3 bacterium]MBD3323605.1 4Fe-4S binding protein [candidate division KSB3 bacterium]
MIWTHGHESGYKGRPVLETQERSMMKERNITRGAQNLTRLVVLGVVTYFALMHQLKGVLVAPNAHVFCPFGGLESLYKLVAEGGYIKKIFPATMVLLVGSVLLTVVLNRAFCGWICPLGTLQAIFARIAKFFKIKKIQVPAQVEQALSYLKYVLLIVILYFTWRVGDLVYAYYDPWAAYTHVAAGFGELYDEFLIGTLFLLVGMVGSLWLPNNFCRYFC